MPDLEARLRDLERREAARTLLYTYADRIDAADFDAVAALFRPDASYDFMGHLRNGRDAIVARLQRALSEWDRTSHHVSNVLVRFDGDAVLVSAGVYAYHVRDSGAVWHVWGRYRQRLVPDGETLAIAEMQLVGIDSSPPA
jgi:uncharacterized protein (TIGR02246 family)